MKLNVFSEEKIIGTLDDDDQFNYEADWINDPDGFDISFKIRRGESFQKSDVKSFFSNILMEGDLAGVLARKHQIDPDDYMSFLQEFGIDCAGALIIQEEKFLPTGKSPTELKWSLLDQRVSKRQPLASIEGSHFSLAGAQDKLPVILQGDDLFLPTETHPSTHILKPISNWENVRETVFNEWFCMRLAREVGLTVPLMEIIVSEHPYYMVERYDRREGKRLHQQDACQALGFMPTRKYESRGGPGFPDIYRLVQEHSQNKFHDLQDLLKWFSFNILIGNHDSHAKNVSFLYKDGKWALAPFYDLMSTAAYPDFTKNFAFSVGGQFQPFKWKRSHFEMLENALGIKVRGMNAILNEMIENMVLSLPQVEYEGRELLPKSHIDRKILRHIEKTISVMDQRVLR